MLTITELQQATGAGGRFIGRSSTRATVPSMNRIHLHYGLLFLGSAAATTAYLHAGRGLPDLHLSVPALRLPWNTRDAAQPVPVALAGNASAPAPAGATVDARIAATEVKPDAMEAEAARVRSTAATSLAATDPLERADAVRDLGTVPTSESLYALSQALQDRTVGVRIEAIDSLRNVAASWGDADGHIGTLLRIAASDHDPVVAERARSALSELDGYTASR